MALRNGSYEALPVDGDKLLARDQSRIARKSDLLARGREQVPQLAGNFVVRHEQAKLVVEAD